MSERSLTLRSRDGRVKGRDRRSAREDRRDLAGEVRGAVGLADQPAGWPLAGEGARRIAGGEEDLHVGPRLQRLARQGETVERTRHDDVGEEEIDRRIALDDA